MADILTNRAIPLSPEIEKRRLITVQQAADLKAISVDTFRRTFPDLIRKISPRRVGVRLGDVLKD
jgi:hypothetical protein